MKFFKLTFAVAISLAALTIIGCGDVQNATSNAPTPDVAATESAEVDSAPAGEAAPAPASAVAPSPAEMDSLPDRAIAQDAQAATKDVAKRTRNMRVSPVPSSEKPHLGMPFDDDVVPSRSAEASEMARTENKAEGFGGGLARGGGGFGNQSSGGGGSQKSSSSGEAIRRSKNTVPSQNVRTIDVAEFDIQPGEELWVIAKGVSSPSPEPNGSRPGCGCLMAIRPEQTVQVPVPLKHTNVVGNIDGYVSSVTVTQQFHNPFDSKIEAIYVFPLPDDAAVNEFVMTVGERRIRGIIRERQAAEKIYNQAKAQGHVASLLNQDRANVFTQKVANIEPGKQIDINIRYFNTLRYDDGSYEFVFPMVVGPRFNPPATTDGIGAVARNANGTSGQSTEVTYLAPHERSGHDISLKLNINAGVKIEAVNSVNHQIVTTAESEGRRTIQLAEHDQIPNKDFVLRYQVAGTQIKTALMTHEDQQGKYFTMMVYPPAELSHVNRSPMEMVFVIDCSGSMSGKPLNQSKNAIRHALRSLTDRDTFQIIRFSSDSSQLGDSPVVASEDNIRKGLEYLDSLKGGGGTQMIEGIKAALDFPHDEGRFRLVSFMTDGYIGNEQQILTTLHKKLGASRIFSFGVGSAPNRMLMNRMAVLGKGAVTYLSLNDDAVRIMDRFNRRISHPAMTDLSIDWGTMNVTDVYPQRLPDLIVGRPIVMTGRFDGEVSAVKINGRVDLEAASFAVDLSDKDVQQKHEGIAAVWARLKIQDSMNELARRPALAEEIKTGITATALNYNLMSKFTSFVAVDSLSKTAGATGTTVNVAVPVPNGVKYETTVSGTDG